MFPNLDKYIRTSLVCLVFMGYGMSSCLLGSSLLDLQIRVQETFTKVSQIIIVRAVGNLLGFTSFGFFEKNVNPSFGIFMGALGTGIMNIFTPWGTSFTWLAICVFVCAIFHGLLDLCCHISLIEIWGEKASNSIQALHMVFGIGALSTPLIARPFFLPHIHENSADDLVNMQFKPEDVRVQYAFLIVGGYMVTTGLSFIFYCLKDRKSKIEAKKGQPEVKISDFSKPEVPLWRQYVLVIIVSINAHVAFAVEQMVAAFAQAFGVKSDLRMEKEKAALLVTAFWTCYSFFKIIFIPLAMYFGERRMVFINMLIMLISLLFMVPHAAYNQICAWISFSLLGIGYSPLFAVAYASLEGYFKVNARQTAIIFGFGILGESLHAPIIGYCLDINPYIFTYYLSVISLVFLFCMGIQGWASDKLCKKYIENNAKPDLERPRLPSSASIISNTLSLASLKRNSIYKR